MARTPLTTFFNRPTFEKLKGIGDSTLRTEDQPILMRAVLPIDCEGHAVFRSVADHVGPFRYHFPLKA